MSEKKKETGYTEITIVRNAFYLWELLSILQRWGPIKWMGNGRYKNIL